MIWLKITIVGLRNLDIIQETTRADNQTSHAISSLALGEISYERGGDARGLA